MIKRLIGLTGLVVCCSVWAFAQAPRVYTSGELYLKMEKLKVLGSVLYIAAHPDDENTRLLAYLSNDRLYRTGYLSLTRGDGGQNLIGDEQGIELGMIRTQELLSARRMDGAEQFFSRAFDFGFSKSTDEALQTWGRDKILSDAVWVIRKFRPDVIITRFPEDARAGHGHHSGSAVIAHEAWEAAGDPNKFPEQFKYGVKPWKAKRIFWNTYRFGGNNTTSDDQLHIDVGGYNAILGKSYGEIAAESRSQHKSQGFGVPGSRGVSYEYFSLTEGAPADKELLQGVNTSWSRVNGGAAIGNMIDQLLKEFSLQHPERSVPALLDIYKKMDGLKDDYWKQQKMAEVKELIAQCSGLWLEATTSDEMAVQGDHIRINFSINKRQGTDFTIKAIKLKGFDTVLNKSLPLNENIAFNRSIYIEPDAPLTQPYWLVHPMNKGSFNIPEQELIGKPENDPAYEVSFVLSAGGQDFTFTRPVQYKSTDPVKGELYEPLVVTPPVTVSTDPDILIFNRSAPGEKSFTVNVQAQKNISGYKARLSKKLTYDNSFKADNAFTLARGASRTYNFDLHSQMLNGLETDHAEVSVQLENGQKTQPASLNITGITYDHIPHIHYFSKDSVKLLNIDLKTEGSRIGYIVGAGDKVPQALEQMGYSVTILQEKDLAPAGLQSYDAIITGVRAFNVHDYLANHHDALMDYVSHGGNLIVQYNTNNNISSINGKIGPYPFSISRNRVTDETAKVSFAQPDHPVLNYPNKITEKDFENWIQERGIYFAERPDAHYAMPLSMSDPAEETQTGSLLITDYGKGKFVYTGLVFFRELPAGVPGAYRLMANIIALNKKKGF